MHSITIKNKTIPIRHVPMLKNKGMAIITNGDKPRSAWRDNLLRCFFAAGILNKRTDEISAFEYDNIEEIAAQRQWGVRLSNVVYDESGTFDDIALVKSWEIGETNFHFQDRNLMRTDIDISPEVRNRIPESRNAELSDMAEICCTNALIHTVSPMFSHIQTKDLITNTRIMLEGISCGIIDCPLSEDDIEQYLSAQDIISKYEEFGTAPLILARNKLINLSEHGQELFDYMKKAQDIVMIWKHATAFAGIPIDFHLDVDAKMDVKNVEAIARLVGMPAMLDALVSGVAIEDIVA